MPNEPGAHGLLALMLLNDARREARFAEGTIVLLREQDRALWDDTQIAEGRAALEHAVARKPATLYVLQAVIASLHLDEEQDWSRLAALYGELARRTGSAVIELNYAAALAEAGNVETALRTRRAPQPRRIPLPALHPGRAPQKTRPP